MALAGARGILWVSQGGRGTAGSCPSVSLLQFLLIFHKAAAGELQEDSGLLALAKLSEIDVALEGVRGAKDFFEAKVRSRSSPRSLCSLLYPCLRDRCSLVQCLAQGNNSVSLCH